MACACRFSKKRSKFDYSVQCTRTDDETFPTVVNFSRLLLLSKRGYADSGYSHIPSLKIFYYSCIVIACCNSVTVIRN